MRIAVMIIVFSVFVSPVWADDSKNGGSESSLSPVLQYHGDVSQNKEESKNVFYKEPKEALALSLGGTALSYGTVVAALLLAQSGNCEECVAEKVIASVGAFSGIIAPSLGHFYAGEVGRGLLTTGLRGTAMALLLGGGSRVEFSVLGAAGMLSLTIYDILDAPKAVEREEKKHLEKLYLQVSPTLLNTPNGSSWGLGLQGHF